MVLWDRDVVQPLARKYFGQKVVELENLGSYNCRKIAGREAQSEHSTANAIDISAFILADGTRITLINDWEPGDRRSEFLHAVRDERSEEHTSELQSLMRISYAVFCLKKKN